jgi:tetratricopeptide (TPR) repeat protein
MRDTYREGFKLLKRSLASAKYLMILMPAIASTNVFSQSLNEFVSRAFNLKQQHRNEQAISTYDSALKTYPNEPMLYVLKGELIGKLQIGEEVNYQNALREFENALEIDSTYYQAYSSRGILNLDYNRFDLAIVDFTQVLRLTRDDDDRQFYAIGDRANAKLYCKDYEGAIKDYGEALRLRPGDLRTKINLGALYLNSRQLKKAEELFMSALEKEPANLEALNNLASLHIISNHSEKAVPILEEAIKIYPNASDLYSNLGLAKVRLGSPEEGLALINRSLWLSPNDSYAYKHRAIAYIELNKIENACLDLSKSNQLGYSKLFDNEVNEMMEKFCRGQMKN